MSADETSVLVLLVASNAEPWLPDVIEGVRAQTYDEVEVLAVDNASTDSSRQLLAKAFDASNVVSLDRRAGYGRALAAALKVASERNTAADAFLLLHDDAAMEPGTIEAMVAALKRERVGIVGAKLVEWSDPDRLQEVGLTTDRFGRIFNPLERGELDQGQHDGLKEVFYSSSACLLIGREVIERVGLFDLRYVALRDDFDLSWRARIAGYRTVVTTDARVRHVSASTRGERPGIVTNRARYFSDRNMFATLIKNYSLPYLAVALPVTFAVSILNVLLFAFTGRRHAARQTLSALQWNLVHLPSTLRLRARSQRRRKNRDREVVKLLMRGMPRVRSYVERALESVAGDPAEGIDEDGVRPPGDEAPKRAVRDFVKDHPVGIAGTFLLLVYLFGARHLYGSGGLAGADLAPFPSRPGDFFAEFFSGWRSAGTGGAAPASPALFLAGVLSIVSFGSVRLAERILVLSLIPLAAASASACARALGLPPRARRTAAIAYALSPLALASFTQGRIPDLILVAALPVLLLPALRAGGFASPGDWRSMGTGVIGLAVVASFAPWALPAVAGSAIVLGGASMVAGHRDGAVKLAVTGLAQAGGAFVLLLPWSAELLKEGSPFGSRPGPYGVPMTDLVRLLPGGRYAIPGVIAWAFPVIAAAGVALAIAARLRIARTFAVAGTVAALLAWAVSRGTPWIAPRPALPLTLAALAVALLIGIAAEGSVPSLSARSFGAFHLGVGSLAVYGSIAAVLAIGFLGSGESHGLQRSGDLAPAFFTAESRQLGDFRVLWLGGRSRALRADLSAPEGETMLTFQSRRAGGGERYLEGSLASVLARTTEQGGRLLAPLGVRYVVLRAGIDPDVQRAFARQVDMSFAQRFRGVEILANDAWLPVGGGVSSARWIAASRGAASRAAVAAASLSLDPGRAGAMRRERPAAFSGRALPTARAILLAHEFHPDWRADTVRGRVPPARSFGWATSFPIGASDAGRVAVSWRGQTPHRLALMAQVVILGAIAAAWSRSAARERGER